MMTKKITTFLSFTCIVGLSFFVSSCKSGWPAIPKGSHTNTYVKATRVNENNKEVERIEARVKRRTWQFLVSPEGGVEHDYFIWKKVYLVDKEGEHLLKFLSTKEEHPAVSYYDYFPVRNSSKWITLGIGESAWRKENVDIDIVIFGKDGVVQKIPVHDCLVEYDGHSYKRKWKHEENSLKFETKSGAVQFDLINGKLLK